MSSCNPATQKCCFKIVAQRKHKGQVEVVEFHNRPEHEAIDIQRSYAPGSHAYRKEGWRMTDLAPMRCSRARENLGRAKQPRRRRRRK